MYIKQMIALHRPSAKDRNLRNIFQTVDYGIQHQIGRLVKNQPHTSDRRIMIDQQNNRPLEIYLIQAWF